ncbi:MAG: lipid-A-disaccharide synthase [Candidatus Pseudobacter hemicellulosilyticus]|uniref:Lipid-A-disaccharide synthase n=1 Tax=Candidatus Pseudobacter hemicellulosilyticus TaxID=3121375 RepID=A0AAJ5WSU5_9BACT|nr:MAG: lipid-A-disaccharide synthase [Pseudobacter sp.]
MRYYMIAGEASGDLHGSNLIKALQQQDPDTSIRCWGGDLMQQAGGELVKHYRDLAFMGFIEVVSNLGTILRNLRFCKEDIRQHQPDAIILIDYPGFNLRIAEWAKQQGIKVIYYISPQVWAWKENRVKKMKQTIDKMLVILPFEKDYYRNKWQWEVEYVGHPLVEVVDSFTDATIAEAARPKARPRPKEHETADKPVIAILPGSRKQEILKKLPIMLEVTRKFPEYEFVVAEAPGQEASFYKPLLRGYPNVSSVRGQTYELLYHSSAAMVTSGTATLETALFGVPEVVCYKGSNISYQIAKRLIKVKYISLVNLIMDKLVVKELIQDDLTPRNIRAELNELLNNEERKQQVKQDYASLKQLLGEGGHASTKAAVSIVNFLRKG